MLIRPSKLKEISVRQANDDGCISWQVAYVPYYS